MKILITGDLHFIKPQFKWIEEQKNQYDCLCLTGDFLDERSSGFYEQAEWVSKWIKTLDKQIFICSGNHDLDNFGECEWLEGLRSTKVCTDNQIKLFKGIKFGCIPYLGANFYDFYDCDILLNHVPPFKTSTSIDVETKKDWGDKELYKAIKTEIIRPHYIFSGHVDKPTEKRDQVFGVEIINPGSQRHDMIPEYKILSYQ